VEYPVLSKQRSVLPLAGLVAVLMLVISQLLTYLKTDGELQQQEQTRSIEQQEPIGEQNIKEEAQPLKWDIMNQTWAGDLFPLSDGTENWQKMGVPSSETVSKFLDYTLPWISCGNLEPLPYPRPPPERSVFVVDLVMMAYDIDVLEVRLYEHAPHVDLFIIVESNTTQRGAVKPMYFEYYRSRFGPLLEDHRIAYLRHKGNVKKTDAHADRKDDWHNENAPRDMLFDIVQRYNNNDNQKPSIFLNSDVDDIWSREALGKLVQNGIHANDNKVYSPSQMVVYSNGVYSQPNIQRNSGQGAIPTAWSLPKLKLPKFRSDAFIDGRGFQLSGFFSPVGWMSKELSLAEAGIIFSHDYANARERLIDPYTTFNRLRAGVRPCCPNDKQRPLRETNAPIPMLLREFPDRLPYLMGSERRCPPHEYIGDLVINEVCTPLLEAFGFCHDNL